MSVTSSENQFSLITQFRNGLTRRQLRTASLDLRNGWNRKSLWFTLGVHDVRQRYRRSFIGPFWITISLGITVAALGLLYGKIFNRDIEEFIPYLAAGYTVWALISQLVTDGTNTFIGSERFIRQLSAPLSIHVFKVVWTNIIIFAHNIWVFVIAAIIFPVEIGWPTFLAFPGIFLILLNGVWVALLFGLLSARFRDIPLIVRNIIHVTFFITPILWSVDMLPGRAFILDYNPVYHFIEIVRAPLLGQIPSLYNWVAAISITIVGWVFAFCFYTIYRWRIAYWI